MRSFRWHSLFRLAVLVACVCVLGVYAVQAHAARPYLTTRIAEQQLSTWRCQDQIGQQRTRSSVSPWALPKKTAYRTWVLGLWTKRSHVCRVVLREQQRQWNWQAWLPQIWKAIAACETGINWQHNSGTYQGAFGFATTSWDAFRPAGYPSEAYLASPWQQYQVALRIYARYGFSGWGCYTHGGYRAHM